MKKSQEEKGVIRSYKHKESILYAYKVDSIKKSKHKKR